VNCEGPNSEFYNKNEDLRKVYNIITSLENPRVFTVVPVPEICPEYTLQGEVALISEKTFLGG
jgi:hypothetical protein